VPYKAFKTADGDILLGGGNDRLYGVICNKLGKPEWAVDERFKTNALRVQNRDTLEDLIEQETKKKTTKELLDLLEGSGMPYAAINDVQDTLEHEHGTSTCFPSIGIGMLMTSSAGQRHGKGGPSSCLWAHQVGEHAC
jgi:crotonobetainyl-CoA:carnitine CoA-transferase CaiB-like acyl-CoA transferase